MIGHYTNSLQLLLKNQNHINALAKEALARAPHFYWPHANMIS